MKHKQWVRRFFWVAASDDGEVQLDYRSIFHPSFFRNLEDPALDLAGSICVKLALCLFIAGRVQITARNQRTGEQQAA